MTIKEGIVLCKWTGALVGFEDLNISHEINKGPYSGACPPLAGPHKIHR